MDAHCILSLAAMCSDCFEPAREAWVTKDRMNGTVLPTAPTQDQKPYKVKSKGDTTTAWAQKHLPATGPWDKSLLTESTQA